MEIITPRMLLNLRSGALLCVRLRSGRELDVTLRYRPSIALIGKPGLHRVVLDVVDHVGINKINPEAHVVCGRRLKMFHTILGNQVVEIK